MSSEKRSRSANFSGEEKILLLNIVKKYSHILESKKTDSVTWRDKDETWIKVSNEFNASCPSIQKRTVDNLKKFYENQKKIVRKKAADERVNLYATGGGPVETKVFNDPTFDLTMSIINKKSVYGLQNRFDGDSSTALNTVTADNVQIETVEEINIGEELENVEEIIFEVDAETVADSTNWQHYKPLSMKKPLTENLKNVIKKDKLDHRTLSKRKLDEDNGWSTRRRPTALNITLARKFEELTEVKAELAKLQLAILKEEKSQLDMKREWEHKNYVSKQEIHDLQKISLQLDIEIKKKQLNMLSLKH